MENEKEPLIIEKRCNFDQKPISFEWNANSSQSI